MTINQSEASMRERAIWLSNEKRFIYDHPLKLTLRRYAMLFATNNERLGY